ncbi:hypothetical protein [Haloarchaeobius sp. DT45]|uniref:hypothetical protein n=1 Tax=Haloarchaeobius sp. DT45 TaxID=3446116 RepID=UPI003F6AD4AE
MTRYSTRRRLLALTGSGLFVLLAGCGAPGEEEDDEEGNDGDDEEEEGEDDDEEEASDLRSPVR